MATKPKVEKTEAAPAATPAPAEKPAKKLTLEERVTALEAWRASL